MKELGRKGGRASGGVKPESVPLRVREELRTIDPKIVRAAVEQALTGSNEAARISGVKLLSDLDVFGRDACPQCAKSAAVDMAAVRAKLETQLQRKLDATDRAIEERAEQLAQERLAVLKAEHAPA